MTAPSRGGLLALLFFILLTGRLEAEPAEEGGTPSRVWAGRGALSLTKNQVEFGVFSPSRIGITDRLELALHPVFLFFLPRASLKANWWNQVSSQEAVFGRSGWALSSLHALSYPTRFLNFVSKQGSLGLLPEDTRVPFALQLDTGLILTRYQNGHALSLGAVGSFAPHKKDDVPLLDFPFFYQRLAPFYAPFVPRLGFSASGPLWGPLSYDVSSQFIYMPIEAGHGVQRAWAVESTFSLRWTFLTRHRINLGSALATAEYPIGIRTYVLPTIDYRLSLF